MPDRIPDIADTSHFLFGPCHNASWTSETDVGAGETDVIATDAVVVAAGAGDLLTAAIVQTLGIPQAAAEWSGASPAAVPAEWVLIVGGPAADEELLGALLRAGCGPRCRSSGGTLPKAVVYLTSR
jgi:hypothetical protein